MYAKQLVTVTGLLVLAQQGYALTINTPASLTQCVPAQLVWSDGTAPFYLSVLPGADPSATAIKQFEATSDTSRTWTVDIPAGTEITLALTDSTGTNAYSSQITVQAGSSSCLSGSGSSSSAASSADTTDSRTSTSGRASSTVTSASRASTDTSETSSRMTTSVVTTSASTTSSGSTTSATTAAPTAPSATTTPNSASSFRAGFAALFFATIGIIAVV